MTATSGRNKDKTLPYLYLMNEKMSVVGKLHLKMIVVGNFISEIV